MAALNAVFKIWSRSRRPLTAAILIGVYVYARLQGRLGWSAFENDAQGRNETARPSRRSFRSQLAASSLARREMVFKMRDGADIACRIVDCGGILSVYADGDYEVPGIDWRQVRTVIDIGAHVGSFSIWAARRAPSARILAVEPNPFSYEVLQANIKRNGLQDRVRARHAAVGLQTGTSGLELVAHTLGTRMTRSGAGEVTVRVETLAEVVRDADVTSIDLLKIDCEGAEYDVFLGGDPAQLDSFRAIACEYHPESEHSVKELDDLFTRRGFSVVRPDAALGVLWAVRRPQSTS